MTTVGYGDMAPDSVPGRILAIIIMFCGISLIAIVTGTISSIFTANKIMEGKSELYNYLSNSKGTIFLNIDNENQVKKIKKIPFISFGQNKKSDYQLSYSRTDNKLELNFKAHKFESALHGEYNFQNIAAAIVIGNYFKTIF